MGNPSIRSRVDQAKYRAGCLQLRNMLPLKSGPGDPEDVDAVYCTDKGNRRGASYCAMA